MRITSVSSNSAKNLSGSIQIYYYSFGLFTLLEQLRAILKGRVVTTPKPCKSVCDRCLPFIIQRRSHAEMQVSGPGFGGRWLGAKGGCGRLASLLLISTNFSDIGGAHLREYIIATAPPQSPPR
jgi:hypothetical protein